MMLAITSATFTRPVAYEMALAGNFGEPRPNHFHGGIDIKTGGVEGKPIYSIGDGYVSRITVGLYGFGNAIYVAHPEGMTSIYCHLKSFTPRIQNLLRQWQYEHETAQADVHLKPTDCPVAQGQLIAISGNTGSSQAPHLHLELHETRTWNMLDPLDFLGSYVNDGLPPSAHGIMAYPMSGEGSFCGGTGKQTFRIAPNSKPPHFKAWGKVGFAIWADDYMEQSYNRYGVKETILTVDGREVFHSNVNSIPYRCNSMVNSWGDYEYYYRTGVWYMKSFIDPGNTLPIFKTDGNRGIIDFNEEREYHLEYILRDFHGNASTCSFIIDAQKTSVSSTASHRHNPATYMRWNRTNMFSYPGIQLVIPTGNIAEDLYLHPVIREQSSTNLSPQYSFYHRSLPLFHHAELSIAVRGKVQDSTKLCIISRYDRNRFVGGEYHDGWVTATIRELAASYELEYDDRPPAINPVGQSSWSSSHTIRMSLSDDKSGIKSFRGYIDGQFVLFEPIARSSYIACNLRESPVKKTGRQHRLKLTATDNCNNSSTYECDIVY